MVRIIKKKRPTEAPLNEEPIPKTDIAILPPPRESISRGVKQSTKTPETSPTPRKKDLKHGNAPLHDPIPERNHDLDIQPPKASPISKKKVNRTVNSKMARSPEKTRKESRAPPRRSPIKGKKTKKVVNKPPASVQDKEPRQNPLKSPLKSKTPLQQSLPKIASKSPLGSIEEPPPPLSRRYKKIRHKKPR